MRLIDADTVQVDFECAPYYKCNSGIMRQIGGGLNRPCTFSERETLLKWKDILDILDASPTIEAEPVRHGQWVVVEPYGWNRRGYNVTPKIKCSVCEHVPKEHKTEDYGQGGTIVRYTWDRTLFCPNCGAKMDAKED